MAQLIAPFAPHIAEEAWELLGQKFSVHNSSWPTFDEAFVKEEVVVIAVQVDGKLRTTIEIEAEKVAERAEIVENLEKDDKLARWISGKRYDVIYVPGKVVNFVTKV